MDIIRLKTAATVEPVSTAEAKAHAVVSAGSADDTLLAGYIKAARALAEVRTNAALVESTWEQVLGAFPVADSVNPYAAIELRKHPVLSVTSIIYVDGDGVSQTIDSAHYSLKAIADHGVSVIYPAYGYTWPTDIRDQPEAIVVTFRAGWALTGSPATTPTTPEAIKHWIMQRVATWYARREDAVEGSGSMLVAEMPRTFVDHLLDPYYWPR